MMLVVQISLRKFAKNMQEYAAKRKGVLKNPVLMGRYHPCTGKSEQSRLNHG